MLTSFKTSLIFVLIVFVIFSFDNLLSQTRVNEKDGLATLIMKDNKIYPDYFLIPDEKFEEYKVNNSKWFISSDGSSRLFFVPYTDYSITTAILTQGEPDHQEQIKLLLNEGIQYQNIKEAIVLKELKSLKGMEIGLSMEEVKKIFGSPLSENVYNNKLHLTWKFKMEEKGSDVIIGGLKPFIMNDLEYSIEVTFKENKIINVVYSYEVP